MPRDTLSVFTHEDYDQHERIVFFNDTPTKLRGIIAIHNTHLGGALGGCRILPYVSEEAALKDALRLSRGMSYKAALADVPHGGGKAVILADPTLPPKEGKNEAFWKAFAKVLNELNGLYKTGEDSGTSVPDMQTLSRYTPYVTGLPTHPQEDDGDPSPYTAYGVYIGLLAAVKHRLQQDSLTGLRIAVQGLGNVGWKLCERLQQAGARLIVTDINKKACEAAHEKFGASIVPPDGIFSVSADIFSPNALGGILSAKTIPLLKVALIAGAANNQLATPSSGQLLHERGILYSPDYVINAGGLIRASYTGKDFTRKEVCTRILKIGDRLSALFVDADQTGLPPDQRADQMAKECLHTGGR